MLTTAWFSWRRLRRSATCGRRSPIMCAAWCRAELDKDLTKTPIAELPDHLATVLAV